MKNVHGLLFQDRWLPTVNTSSDDIFVLKLCCTKSTIFGIQNTTYSWNEVDN